MNLKSIVLGVAAATVLSCSGAEYQPATPYPTLVPLPTLAPLPTPKPLGYPLVPYDTPIASPMSRLKSYQVMSMLPTDYNGFPALVIAYDTDGNGLPDFYEQYYVASQFGKGWVELEDLIASWTDSDENGVPDYDEREK